MTRSRVPPVTRQYGVNRRAKILIAWLTWALSVLKLKLSGATTRLAYAYVNKVMFLLDVAHPKQNVTFRSRVSILSSCAVLNLLGLISTMQLRNGFLLYDSELLWLAPLCVYFVIVFPLNLKAEELRKLLLHRMGSCVYTWPYKVRSV